MNASEFFRRVAAVLFGLVLFLGGLLKLTDPVGAQLVMESYLNFLHLGFLRVLVPVLTLFFNLLETFVGIALIAWAWTRWIRWIALGLMCFFTLLTLLLLIFNPAMDCGCFGELVHLTHWQSFLKNIVLLLLWVVAFVPTGKLRRQHVRRPVLAGMAMAGAVVFGIHGYRHLPLLDLTDLKLGTELTEGKVSLLGEDGDYHDELALDGRVLLISVYDPAALSKGERERIGQTASEARALGLKPIIATAQPLDHDDMLEGAYIADRKTLKSLNRSNGGATYISDGQIVRKWRIGRSTAARLGDTIAKDPATVIGDSVVRGRLTVGIYLLVTIVLILI